MNKLYLKNPESIRPNANKVLVEYFDLNKTIKLTEDIDLTVSQDKNYSVSDGTSTGEGRHTERMGRVVAVCDSLKTEVGTVDKSGVAKVQRTWDWETDIEIEPGDWVWWPSSEFANAPKFYHGERKFVVVDYHKLRMKQNEDGSRMLNDNILLEAVEKKHEGLIEKPFKEYYKDIYKLVKRGTPVRYTRKYYDDPEFKEGDYVMIRFNVAPKLEETGHRYFDDRDLYVVQAKDLIAWANF